ncbi:IPExxxVDY family protein [Tenacibaculum geojense]|uniref:IPExxxVDY family protein n=1 Tax=Tenacibaculum geojense TaxID=915352 RepID=A0ABW3JTR5_9FLAO
MPVYSLEIDDFSDNDYALIGIHTTLEDYKLAFFLNQHLKTNFKRASYNLDFENKNYNSSFAVYENKNASQHFDWYLISNVFKTKIQSNTAGLFPESDTKVYLIPEKKRVDFFIKIDGEFDYEYIVKTVEAINKLPQVITSYSIETNTLKSKESLIF